MMDTKAYCFGRPQLSASADETGNCWVSVRTCDRRLVAENGLSAFRALPSARLFANCSFTTCRSSLTASIQTAELVDPAAPLLG